MTLTAPPASTSPGDAGGGDTAADLIRQTVLQVLQEEHIIRVKYAVVQSVNFGLPLTVTVEVQAAGTSGGTTSTIPNVRCAMGYAPNVGDTCILAAVGSDLWAMAALTGEWYGGLQTLWQEQVNVQDGVGNPAGSGRVLVQLGLVTGTLAAGGVLTHTFPVPFPGGVQGVFFINDIAPIPGPSVEINVNAVVQNSTSKTGFTMQVWQAVTGNPLAVLLSGTVVATYIAVGF